jgi:hypothetical protein
MELDRAFSDYAKAKIKNLTLKNNQNQVYFSINPQS